MHFVCPRRRGGEASVLFAIPTLVGGTALQVLREPSKAGAPEFHQGAKQRPFLNLCRTPGAPTSWAASFRRTAITP